MVTSVELASESSVVVDPGRLTGDERRRARVGALLAVGLFLLVATWGRPWNIFDTSVASSDIYDVQARSIAHGHLDIPSSVAGVEGIPLESGTQVYFGVGPSLLRLPLTGWTDAFDRRLGVLSMSVAVAVLGLAAARLLKRAEPLVAGTIALAPRWFGVMAFAAVACTPVLFMATRSVVYTEAILWGAAASLAGLDLVLRWWRTQTWGYFVAAVAVGTFAVSCRPTSGVAPGIALGLFGLVLLRRREWSKAGLVITGAVFTLIGFALVNWLRFGMLFGQPYGAQTFSLMSEERRAFLEDNSGSILGLQFVPTTVARYFSPIAMGWQRLFPFVNFGRPATVIGDVTFDGTYQSSSLPLGAPVLFVFACIGTWWTVLRDRTREWSVVAIAAVLSTFGTLAAGFVNHRYLVDFVPALVVLACPGILLITQRADGWSRGWRRLGLAVAIVVSLFATWTQIGLAVQYRAFSITPTESDTRAFLSLQNAIDRRVSDQPFPDVQMASGDTLPTDGIVDGTVVILDDCAGLYRYDGYYWAAAERKPGAGRRYVLTGTVTDEPRPMLTGFGWTVTVQRTDEGVVFVYDSSYGRRDVSEPIVLPEGVVTFDVVADQAGIPTLSVRFDDRVVFRADFLGITKAQPAEGWVSTPGAAPLCESLRDRMVKR